MPPQSPPQPQAGPPPSPYPDAPNGQAEQTPAQPDYDFIMNSQKSPRINPFSRLPGASLPIRIAYISGALLVLLILIVIIRSLFGGDSYVKLFFNTAQDQQAIVYLAEKAGEERSLSSSTQDFAATARITLASSQTDTLKYMVKNGQKVDTKKLGLKVDPAIDKQLEDALAAATYDRTFRGIMNKKLVAYMNDLSYTYKQTKGSKGRALLNDEYKQAKLLQMQLSESAP